MREEGYIYVRAINDPASDIVDAGLRDPYCTGFETSDDGKLSWMRIPSNIRVLRIPSGTAIRVPTSLGARLGASSDFNVISAEEFYSRGAVPPDGYSLLAEVKKLKAEAKLRKSAPGGTAAKEPTEAPTPKRTTKKRTTKKRKTT